MRTTECPNCGGQGRFRVTDAARRFSADCARCHGTGQIDDNPVECFLQRFGPYDPQTRTFGVIPEIDLHDCFADDPGVNWREAFNRAVGIEQAGLPQLKSPEAWLADSKFKIGPRASRLMIALLERAQRQAFECGVAMAEAEHSPQLRPQ